MTIERPEGKNHGEEEENGLLEDKGLDDLDLEALLADDFPKEKEAAAGAERSAPGDVAADDVIELDDDIELLDDESAGPDAAKGSREPSASAEPSSVEEPVQPADEISMDDLLAEDESPAPKPFAVEEPPGGEVTPEEPSQALADDDEATKVLPDAEEVSAEKDSAKGAEEMSAEKDSAKGAAETSTKDKKAGKKKFGKKEKKFGKKEKEKKEEEPSGEKKEAEPEPERKPAKAGVRGALTFVCSECYEEFLLPPNFSQEMVSCPECLHVGKRPDADFLRSVKMHKAGERKFLAAATVCGALLLIVLLALFYVISPYFVTGGQKLDEILVYALMGGAGLLAAILVWLIIRFEGNRWEVYF